MRIVVDMQGAQSIGSRARGIGRYSMAFSKPWRVNVASMKSSLP